MRRHNVHGVGVALDGYPDAKGVRREVLGGSLGKKGAQLAAIKEPDKEPAIAARLVDGSDVGVRHQCDVAQYRIALLAE